MFDLTTESSENSLWNKRPLKHDARQQANGRIHANGDSKSNNACDTTIKMKAIFLCNVHNFTFDVTFTGIRSVHVEPLNVSERCNHKAYVMRFNWRRKRDDVFYYIQRIHLTQCVKRYRRVYNIWIDSFQASIRTKECPFFYTAL